ncbi:MAG: hypothetical protein NTZ51_04750 [Proteobacteria bacterium]|nr:hypothetical protein [Pseudomonadota bacterium]
MAQESYADFSIVKKYFEIKNKYDLDMQSFKDKLSSGEETFGQEISAHKEEIARKNEQIQSLEKQLQEMATALREKEEMLKNLGLQLHKLKPEMEESRNKSLTEDEKKGKFSIFK